MKNTTTLKGFIKATITAGVIGIYTLVAHAEGINEAEFWNWINSYLNPLTNILFGVIPVSLVIYLLLKALEWYKNEQNGEQQPRYAVTVSKGIQVAIIAMSINVILKIVSISSR
jgi:hypothetical protein